jgi:GTP diphosphokinase / guanosine-3',5'-bis(diphosphate) 3'-diphosphatase
MTRLNQLAKDYCKYFHNGQFRKGSNQPYHTHPIAVARILEKYGHADETTQCMALLHDVVEDTQVIMGQVKERFGYEIANGVFVLSKNTLGEKTTILYNEAFSFDLDQVSKDDLYKLRLGFARNKVKRVKIADVIHNTQDLINLKPQGIEKKLNDARNFYIPMGKIIAPLMVQELEANLENYLQKSSSV